MLKWHMTGNFQLQGLKIVALICGFLLYSKFPLKKTPYKKQQLLVLPKKSHFIGNKI